MCCGLQDLYIRANELVEDPDNLGFGNMYLNKMMQGQRYRLLEQGSRQMTRSGYPGTEKLFIEYNDLNGGIFFAVPIDRSNEDIYFIAQFY